MYVREVVGGELDAPAPLGAKSLESKTQPEVPKVRLSAEISTFIDKVSGMKTCGQFEPSCDNGLAMSLLRSAKAAAWEGERDAMAFRRKWLRFKRIHDTRKAELEAQGVKPDIFGGFDSGPIIGECLQESWG